MAKLKIDTSELDKENKQLKEMKSKLIGDFVLTPNGNGYLESFWQVFDLKDKEDRTTLNRYLSNTYKYEVQESEAMDSEGTIRNYWIYKLS